MDGRKVHEGCDFSLTRCEQPPVRSYEIRFCNQWEVVTRCDRHRVPEGHYRQAFAPFATDSRA